MACPNASRSAGCPGLLEQNKQSSHQVSRKAPQGSRAQPAGQPPAHKPATHTELPVHFTVLSPVHSQRLESPLEQGQGAAAGLAFLLSVGAVCSANIEQRAAGQQVFKEDPKHNSQVLWSVFERSSDISINKTILTLQCTFPIIILPQNG